MNYTDKEKEFILLEYKWEKVTGYDMGYEVPDCNTVIISVEEVKKCIQKKPVDFYFTSKDYEWARNLEEAWECLLDDVYQFIDAKVDKDLDLILDLRLKAGGLRR